MSTPYRSNIDAPPRRVYTTVRVRSVQQIVPVRTNDWGQPSKIPPPPAYLLQYAPRTPPSLPRARPAGGSVPPGAFLLESAVLGDKLTIPAGSKLLSVDGRPTGDLIFEEARDVALSAGSKSVLVFAD